MGKWCEYGIRISKFQSKTELEQGRRYTAAASATHTYLRPIQGVPELPLRGSIIKMVLRITGRFLFSVCRLPCSGSGGLLKNQLSPPTHSRTRPHTAGSRRVFCLSSMKVNPLSGGRSKRTELWRGSGSNGYRKLTDYQCMKLGDLRCIPVHMRYQPGWMGNSCEIMRLHGNERIAAS